MKHLLHANGIRNSHIANRWIEIAVITLINKITVLWLLKMSLDFSISIPKNAIYG